MLVGLIFPLSLLSLVSRPPPFLRLRFAFTKINRSGIPKGVGKRGGGGWGELKPPQILSSCYYVYKHHKRMSKI